MANHEGIDYFARARAVAVTVLIAAGAACVIGAAMDWAVLERCPEVQPGSTFDESELEEPPPCPVRGIDATEGRVAAVAGFLMMIGGTLLVMRGNPSFGWLALLASILAGSFAISAYRGVGDANSSISRRFGLIDAYDVGVGLTLVAAAAVIGIIASVASIAATPRSDDGS